MIGIRKGTWRWHRKGCRIILKSTLDFWEREFAEEKMGEYKEGEVEWGGGGEGNRMSKKDNNCYSNEFCSLSISSPPCL